MTAAVARIFTSLLFLSAMAPFLLMVDPIGQAPVGPAQDSWRCRFSLSGYSRSGLTVVLSSAQAQEIGPQVTGAARDVAPFVVPKNRWEFAAMWGGLGSGSMMQNHVGSSHGSVLSDGVAAGGAAGGAAKDAPQKGSALLVAARAADDARAFWSYGPLVIFAGGGYNFYSGQVPGAAAWWCVHRGIVFAAPSASAAIGWRLLRGCRDCARWG